MATRWSCISLLLLCTAIVIFGCGGGEEGPPPPGHDPALVGKWAEVSETEDGSPVTLDTNFLLTFNANGTYRADDSPLDIAYSVYWESGSWSTSGNIFTAHVTASSDSESIGATHTGTYVVSGDTLTFTTVEGDGTPVTVVMVFARLGLDPALVATWDQTALSEDDVPVEPVPAFTLTMNGDGTFSVDEDGIPDTGDWGTYGGNTLVPIVRSAANPSEIGKQHVSTYVLSNGGNTLTLTTHEVEAGTPHTYVATLSKL